MNSAIRLLAVLVPLITVLAGCAALPIDAEKLSANQYKLIYHKRGVDRVDRMRQELMLKAQEVCGELFGSSANIPIMRALPRHLGSSIGISSA
jgi:hypothetical protein